MTASDAFTRLEEAAAQRAESTFDLTLIVSGASDLSARAISNATRLCETHLAGRSRLSVVDLSEAPSSMLSDQVLAAPTLVKTHPLPVQKFVGDLSRTDRVLAALGISAAAAPVPDENS